MSVHASITPHTAKISEREQGFARTPKGTGLRTNAQGFDSALNPRQQYGLTERDDGTGLDHTWFRKNEGRAGRWTSPDPYNGSMSVSDPQSFNRFSYVANQPTNFIDPSGLLMMDSSQNRGYCVRYHYYNPSTGESFWGAWQCYGGTIGGSAEYLQAAARLNRNTRSDCRAAYDRKMFELERRVENLFGAGGRFALPLTGESGSIITPVPGLATRVYEEALRFVQDVLAGPDGGPRWGKIDTNIGDFASAIASLYGNEHHTFVGSLDGQARTSNYYHNPDSMKRALTDIFKQAVDAAIEFLACTRPENFA